MMPTTISNNATPEQVEELYDIFTEIDKDGTGFVEMQEFYIFLGVAPTEFHKVHRYIFSTPDALT